MIVLVVSLVSMIRPQSPVLGQIPFWCSIQVATQIAVLISKIARYDCPRSWPQLIPILAEAVRVEDALCQQRALLTFYHVTKVLASKRLMHDRKLFEEVGLCTHFLS